MPALEARDIYSPGACIEGWAWVKAYVGRGGVRRGVVWSNRLGKIDKESTTVSAQLGHQLSSGDITYTYASACHFCQLVCKFLHVDVVPCVNLTWFSSRCVRRIMQTFAIFNVRILVGNRLLNVSRGGRRRWKFICRNNIKGEIVDRYNVQVVECLINKYLRTIIR